MLPAHERLHPDDPLRLDIELRLVVNEELVALERLPQRMRDGKVLRGQAEAAMTATTPASTIRNR
jgi:hypothetical protein